MRDLRIIPKFRDSLSYLYVEHCRVDQDSKAVVFHDEQGSVPVPCAALSVLMLGPGTSITHSAIRTLAETGSLVIWCGEENVRFYAQGFGETRKARHLIHQARLCSDTELRMKVVRKMYQLRFSEQLQESLSLQEIRGKEGIRVREAYRRASRETGVEWKGRSYTREAWSSADPVNRALSVANSCLYGICHSAIVSAGYSPSLGFIHTGKVLSFVYDVADLYKTETSIQVAFQTTAEGTEKLESRIRRNCRDLFYETRLLSRIIPDIETVLAVEKSELHGCHDDDIYETDGAMPGKLWDPNRSDVSGGLLYSDTVKGKKDGCNDS